MSRTRLAALCLLCTAGAAAAEDTAAPQSPDTLPTAQSLLSPTHGMFMLDYQNIELTTGGKFDLHGVHYLHGLNDWLFAGIGFGAPMLEGDYGGFFSADLTLHAQTNIFGNWFVDGGVAFGAGAGGSSVANILELSGSGTYLKKYIGLGYDFGSLRAGVNFADIEISNSPINDQVFSFFVQRPLNYSLGKHADSGTTLSPSDYSFLGNETIVSFEYSNLRQIDATGRFSGDIGLVSPQISHFFNENSYYFFGLDLGYSGLVWYNQAQGGLGHRISLTPNINLYGQLGIGSGGWVTDHIDTGPGFVIYPKVKAEYKFSNGLGASVSAGYLAAPLGTSRNWSVGAGLNYHMPSASQAMSADNADDEVALRGLRVNLFQRAMFNIEYNGGPVDDLYLSTAQVDYSFNNNWYIPLQIAAAVNDFRGYAGYVEGFAGIGYETDPFFNDKVQGYAQVLYGLNDLAITEAHDPGALVYPSVGFNYNLNDKFSIYAQAGKIFSTGEWTDPGSGKQFDGTTIGLGVSYRFGQPTWK